jgi:hypothetical protein
MLPQSSRYIASSVLTLGPSLDIQASTNVNLNLDVDLNTVVTYSVQNAELFFPKSASKQSSADSSPQNTSTFFSTRLFEAPSTHSYHQICSDLQLSVTPDIKGQGNVEVHVIPSVRQ